MRRWYCGTFWPASRAAAALGSTASPNTSEGCKGSPLEAMAEDVPELDFEAALPDLPLQYGRPDVPAVLAAHLEAHADIADIAVFVAGMQALLASSASIPMRALLS